MRAVFYAVAAVLVLASTSFGQAHQHGQTKVDSIPASDHGMHMSAAPLDLPMERDGSGTSWLPDASPMYAHHTMVGNWELMLHGNAFLQYIGEGSSRQMGPLGRLGQIGSVNWFMGMLSRPVAAGQLSLKAMLSAEPFTVGKCGYPDLLATGEFCKGEALHDRQHPHDLFMEIAASYERALSRNFALQIYGGPAGEPALGPAGYPHRISAMPGPIAPISHHWQDATHISFGVLTAGLYGRRWKLEGSAFNGREPDENRYNFDLGKLDSYSGRLWLVPNDRVALQVSLGRLNDAEPARDGHAAESITRPTASLTYHQPLRRSGYWSNTLVWGANHAHGQTTHAILAESSLNLAERDVLFARAEVAEKSGQDLAIEDEAPLLEHQVFTVGKIAVGYTRQFGKSGSLVPSVGAQVSVNLVPGDLEPVYGRSTPIGFAIFASLKPRAMRDHKMAAAAPMQGMPGMTHMPTGHAMPADSMSMPMPQHDSTHMRMADMPADHEYAMSNMPASVHEMSGSDAAAQRAMSLVIQLLSDPQVEARIQRDPQLRQLWNDPGLQDCLRAVRRMSAARQPIPTACPVPERQLAPIHKH